MQTCEYKFFLKSRKITDDTVASYLQYLRHISAYHYLTKFIQGKRVLEIGVLNGYGHQRMIQDADFIVGLDLLLENARKTRELIRKKHVSRILVADCQTLPFEKESFDSIILLHVFEHLPKTEEFLKEAKRVLAPEGKLFVSTPNKKLRLRFKQKPYQIEHIREYTAQEFSKALQNHFTSIEMMGLSSDKKEFLESEKLRTKPWRNIFFAYFPQPFKQIVFTRIYQYFYQKKLDKIEKLGKDFFSLSNCIFSEENLDECIDFLAICGK